MNIQRLLTEQTILEPETTREHIAYCFTKHNMKKKNDIFYRNYLESQKKKKVYLQNETQKITLIIYMIFNTIYSFIQL